MSNVNNGILVSIGHKRVFRQTLLIWELLEKKELVGKQWAWVFLQTLMIAIKLLFFREKYFPIAFCYQEQNHLKKIHNLQLQRNSILKFFWRNLPSNKSSSEIENEKIKMGTREPILNADWKLQNQFNYNETTQTNVNEVRFWFSSKKASFWAWNDCLNSWTQRKDWIKERSREIESWTA